MKLWTQLQAEYQGLNPDAADYNARATALGQRMEAFRSATALVEDKELKMQLEQYGLADVEYFVERCADIFRTVQYLRDIDEDGHDFIPPVDPQYKLTPYIEEKFAWFAALANRQLGIGNNAEMERLVANEEAPDWENLAAKGMTVVVGPRGTGKNKLIDHYASITERPLFRYACSPDKEERDLTYDVELSDGEVIRVPTRILQAVTTPNSILELDEVNLLDPATAKFFNSLLDGDRAMYLNDQVIEVAPGVLIVALMNPADYDGVSDLPETIDDRSNVMRMDYPPFKKKDARGRERFTYDEALILRESIAPLKEMSDEQFVALWDQIVNNDANGISVDTTLAKVMKNLKFMVAIANRTRDTVKAHKMRTGTVRMEREVSLRGSIEAARFYSENHLWEKDLTSMPDYEPGWNPAQYAVGVTYIPHTETYRRGKQDKEAIRLILKEAIV